MISSPVALEAVMGAVAREFGALWKFRARASGPCEALAD